MSNKARTNVSQQIAVRLPLDLLAELDAVRGNFERATIMRAALRAWLASVAPENKEVRQTA